MFTIFVSNRSIPVSILWKRLLTHRSATDLGDQMRMLNAKDEFLEVLRLFDVCRENEPKSMLSSMIITQALKACANTRDLERGASIHQLVAARSKEDTYILASLVHLYSRAR